MTRAVRTIPLLHRGSVGDEGLDPLGGFHAGDSPSAGEFLQVHGLGLVAVLVDVLDAEVDFAVGEGLRFEDGDAINGRVELAEVGGEGGFALCYKGVERDLSEAQVVGVAARTRHMKPAATLAILVLAFPALAADLSGKWKASVEGPDGQTMDITFTFKVDGGSPFRAAISCRF